MGAGGTRAVAGRCVPRQRPLHRRSRPVRAGCGTSRAEGQAPVTALRALLAAIAAGLLVPAGAGATTYVVDPAGPVPCDSGHMCGTLAAAVAAVNGGSGSGDVIQVKPGVYKEAVAVTAASATITRLPASTGTATITGGDAQNATISFRGQGPYVVSG